MRFILQVFVFCTIFLLVSTTVIVASVSDKHAMIIEVEGSSQQHAKYIEQHYPYMDVIEIYDTLFQGLAIQVPQDKLSKIASFDFITAKHPVQSYEALGSTSPSPDESIVLPSTLHRTKYTGKGVKVGVIDTGIDYTHPDLASNYVGGYDLVDLDDDPMETMPGEGIPTNHGTHVAGIIAANGKITGVAKDAELYAYRALGPGGTGTSVQVIAAMERAVKDGVDIMNLSLGNTINGPDYPTSLAVNRAVELGVVLVIASGNNGPAHWTLGSPGSASEALTVGATMPTQFIPYLYEAQADRAIELNVMQGSIPWAFKKDYSIAFYDSNTNRLDGKIALVERGGEIPFYEKAKQAEEAGAVAVLIANNEEGIFTGSIENNEHPLQIPVAALSQADGKWLSHISHTTSVYLDTKYKEVEKGIAPFSSRGPVTVNWQIKPDILAPGTNIYSTVPNASYQSLQGTSMAAPHVAGAVAVLKEARPDWSNEQIIGALKTTALPLELADGVLVEPVHQGAGEIQVDEAIETDTIIYQPLVTFGKVNQYHETKQAELRIENMTNQAQDYAFDIPKYRKGMTWKLPHQFTLKGGESKTIPIELQVTTQQLEDDMHQGWLTLNQGSEQYHIPYLFMNKQTDQPKAMGFNLSPKPFSKDDYVYQVYLTEQANSLTVDLYNPETLLFDRELVRVSDLRLGINEGEIAGKNIGEKGHYLALITVELESGVVDTHERELWIE